MDPAESDDFLERIRAPLTELKPLEDYEEIHNTLISRVIDPPSYIAQIVFGIGQFPSWRREEKSRWQVQLSFRGAKFQVRDWKGFSISIDGQDDSEDLRRLATQLLKKIRIAGRILDKELHPHLRKGLRAGGFYLINSYPKAKSLYTQFRDDLIQAISALEDHIKAGGIPRDTVERPKGAPFVYDKAFSDHFNEMTRLSRRIAHYGCAAITFYFAYLDVVMDIVYPFIDKSSVEFLDFRALDWDERFKGTFPVGQDPALKDIYDGLLDVRRRIRNVVVHGYSGDEGILVPLERIGLVPLTYTSFLTAQQYELFAIDPDEGKSALEVFDGMDRWLESSAPFNYVLRYADMTWEIPFDREKVDAIKSEMTTMEEFEEFLQDKARAEDYWSEQY